MVGNKFGRRDQFGHSVQSSITFEGLSHVPHFQNVDNGYQFKHLFKENAKFCFAK